VIVCGLFEWKWICPDFLLIRDRPFNLQGGGYGFLFRSDIFFQTTQELELFFLSRKAQFFFPEFNIRLRYITKTLNQIIFFFLHQNQNIFFNNIGNHNIFLEKNHNPPFKLNGRSLIVCIVSNSEKGWVGIPLTVLTPITLFCLSQTRTWISNIIFCDLFCVYLFEVRGSYMYCRCWWNYWPSLLKLSLPNYISSTGHW
jgi:hypothetical protein